MRWCKAVQGGMRADKVMKKHKHGNEVVGRCKRGKSLFGLVPRLELLVETLDEVVGNVITKALYADVLHIAKRLDRDFVGAVTVGDDRLWFSQIFNRIKQRKSLRAVPVRREMEPKHKAGFSVHNQPKVMLDALDFDYCFVGVPFIGIEIQRRNESNGNVLKQRRKTGTPIADGRMRYLNIHHGTQNQSDIAEGVFAQVKHTQRHENHMDGVSHTFEVGFAKQL